MKTLWIARDENEELWLFDTQPIRNVNQWSIEWSKASGMPLSKDEYPEVTWENSPQEVTMMTMDEKAEMCTEYYKQGYIAKGIEDL